MFIEQCLKVDQLLLAKMRSANVTPATTYRFADASDVDALARVNTVNPAYQERRDYRLGIDRKNEFFLVAERARPRPAYLQQRQAADTSNLDLDNRAIVGMCNYYFMWYKPSRVAGQGANNSNSNSNQFGNTSRAEEDAPRDSTTASQKRKRGSSTTAGRKKKKYKTKLKLEDTQSGQDRVVRARKIMYVATLQATKPDDHLAQGMLSEPRTGIALLCLVSTVMSVVTLRHSLSLFVILVFELVSVDERH